LRGDGDEMAERLTTWLKDFPLPPGGMAPLRVFPSMASASGGAEGLLLPGRLPRRLRESARPALATSWQNSRWRTPPTTLAKVSAEGAPSRHGISL
jgi:hypothetical protein